MNHKMKKKRRKEIEITLKSCGGKCFQFCEINFESQEPCRDKR